MTPKIIQAINAFENAVRDASKKDAQAEMAETWEASKLKRCREAWDKAKAARVELEAVIEDSLR